MSAAPIVGVSLSFAEDIGLGPMTRGYFGMPESSFMLFDTAKAWA